LLEAKRNLEICRAQDYSRAFVAKLEVVNRKNKENQKETKENGEQ